MFKWRIFFFALFFLNIEGLEKLFETKISLLATMHQTWYKLNLHAFPITHFFPPVNHKPIFLNEGPFAPPPGSLKVKKKKKNHFFSVLELVLLSASVERFSVSRVRYFFLTNKKNHLVYLDFDKNYNKKI